MSGMGESPKVLQVTFGSFSCTLEGFEDPVQTLFAVAEHFRDLAERDPGFARGTRIPDAALLARQVEAAGGGTGAVRVETMAEEIGGLDGAPPAPPRAPASSPSAGSMDGLGSEAAAGVADLVRVVAAVAESAGAALAEGARSGARGLDIERLAAALAASRRASPDPAEEQRREEPRPVVARTAPPKPRSEGFHDWGADEVEEEDFTADWREAAPVEASRDEALADGDAAWSDEDETEGRRSEGERDERPRPRFSPHGEGTGDGRRFLSTPPDQDEAGLLRILSRAERQLSDPGVARRRAAMAHLKAAVAATEAQRTLDGDEPAPQDAAAPFREEWAAAARPQAERSERPAPPPLRLVASQRVDATRDPEEAAARPAALDPAEERQGMMPPLRPAGEAPTRPESPLVAVEPPAAAVPSDTSFAAFAARAGATASLPDLIEAAASWLHVVRGEAEASRSQLLRLAAEVLPEPPNREDALRIFGALLRQGRLARIEGGRFRVGDATRFGPARQAV